MTAPEPDASRRAPARNWGGVLITAAGAFALACDAFWLVAILAPFQSGLLEDTFYVQLATFSVVPVAVLAGFVPLVFGSRRLTGIVGPSPRARLLVFTAALVACLAQLGIVAFPWFGSLLDPQFLETVPTVTLIFAVLLTIVAGIVIARAHVVDGYARWSLIVAVALTLVTLSLYFLGLAIEWQDVPRSAGLIALGISYWRVGLVSPAIASSRVTDAAKSLAE